MKEHNVRGASMVAIAALLLAAPACGGPSRDSQSKRTDRWVTTEDTTVEIDWDAVGEAYKTAEGPEDFETKVNEIYTGDDIISVSVHDQDAKTQDVTGFFDRDKDGKVGESEKVFSIRRDLVDESSAQYQVSGHNSYSHYSSPIVPLLAGVATGYMVSRIFSSGYSPSYSQPYVTPTSRHAALTSHRDGYRQSNPDKFKSSASSKSGAGQKSRTGKSYGSKGGNFGGGRSSPTPRPSSRPSGGGRFGIKRRPAKVVRLEA